MCEPFLPLVERNALLWGYNMSLWPIGSHSRASQEVYLYTLMRFDLYHPIHGILIFIIIAHTALYC